MSNTARAHGTQGELYYSELLIDIQLPEAAKLKKVYTLEKTFFRHKKRHLEKHYRCRDSTCHRLATERAQNISFVQINKYFVSSVHIDHKKTEN